MLLLLKSKIVYIDFFLKMKLSFASILNCHNSVQVL